MATRQQLFRQEAIDHQQEHEQWGDVIFLQPLSVTGLFWGAVIATGLILSFLVLAQYSRKETVPGYLSPSEGVVKVFAPRQGTITEIHVQEGEAIEPGQPLLTIVDNQTTAGGENVDALVLDALQGQRDLLSKRIAIQRRRESEERTRLQAKVNGLTQEITHLKAQVAAQRHRVSLLENLRSTEAHLVAKGYFAKNEHARRMEALFAQKQALGEVREELAARRTLLDQERYAVDQLSTIMAEKEQQLRTEMLDVERRIAEADGRRAYEVQAPIVGRVTTLQAFVGRNVDPNQLQLSILPVDSELEARLLVPTRAVGFVRPGQRVRVQYDAFPYQRFGTYGGRVLAVTRTILTGADGVAPFDLKEPAYMVTVGLDGQQVTAYGEAIPLQADMLLNADIILDRGSLMSWLLDPLLSVGMRL